MSRYIALQFSSLAPYVPGEQPQDQTYIKLNTNENPYPPAPGVMDAIQRDQVERLRLYSDPTCRALTQEIAKYYGVKDTQVYVGNSSDEVLAFAFLAFGSGENGVCFPDISYGFYPVYAQLFSLANVQNIPLCDDLSIDPADYMQTNRTVVIANPNAPTGLMLSTRDIERIVQANPDRAVIIDEAYADFARESALSLIDRYENLLIVRTFSKSRALAGARLGYALAQPALIADMQLIKFSFNPYNVNRLTLLAGEAAMRDRAYFESTVQRIIATRESTKASLKALGFTVTDSQANFLFVRPPKLSGEAYYLRLKEKGVLVRWFGSPARIRDYVRISVGTDADMRALLAATETILRGI